tara:strand:+ start:321 stop:1145 length:825 start_codon:yes stop_codon:yes gene_type:complete
MINLHLRYSLREKIPKSIRRILPKIIRRRINRKFFKYYFLNTNLKNLPETSYPEKGDLNYQKNLIKQFDQSQKQTSSMTCPHLMELLLMKFNSETSFSFLDIGGEKIDFYLDLKKNFKNIKYFLFNQKSMTEPFHKIKLEFNFEDFNVIDNFNEISNERYDFVNFGSCIQYFNNYETVLKEVSKNSKNIFFSATHLYDSSDNEFKKDVIVKQVNVLPQVNYLYFFNRNNFFKILTEEQFELVFENKNLTDKVNYDNFNILQNIQYSDFLFSKKD